MRRIQIISLLLVALIFPAAADDGGISFSGAESNIVLRDGEESLVLSGGAEVSMDSLSIKAEDISLSGDGWRFLECSGGVLVSDPEKGITMRTSAIWFDRDEERMLISSFLEIDDERNGMSGTAEYLEYRMKDERLQLDRSISLLRETDDGAMRCHAEQAVFSRTEGLLGLYDDASVIWGKNSYKADSITINLNTDGVLLEGGISGNIAT